MNFSSLVEHMKELRKDNNDEQIIKALKSAIAEDNVNVALDTDDPGRYPSGVMHYNAEVAVTDLLSSTARSLSHIRHVGMHKDYNMP